MEQKARWQWRRKRWGLGLLAFWLIGGGGAGLMARSGSPDLESASSPFIIATMMFFVIWAALTDRDGRRVPLRMVWVVGLWILHAILSVIVLFTFGAYIDSLGKTESLLVDRAMNLWAAFPIVFWAMRRSTFFVELVKDQK